MSQSVKLKDGSYIDASGVWDNTQGSDLESLHEQMGKIYTYGEYAFTPTALNTWASDTAHAITISKGTYIFHVYAYPTSNNSNYMAFFLLPMYDEMTFTPANSATSPTRKGSYVHFYRATESTKVTFAVYQQTSLTQIKYIIRYIKLTN